MKKEILVSYSKEENKKKLEDYIFEVTGKTIDLGPIGYNEDLSIKLFSFNLTDVEDCNIICASYFPGKRFEDVDEFIKWHKKTFYADKLSIIFFSKIKETYRSDYLLEKNIKDIKKINSDFLIRKVHTGHLNKTGYAVEVLLNKIESETVINYLKEEGFKDCLIINYSCKTAYVSVFDLNKTIHYSEFTYHYKDDNSENICGYDIYVEDEIEIYLNHARDYLVNTFKYSKESADKFIKEFYTENIIKYDIKAGMTPLESIWATILGY